MSKEINGSWISVNDRLPESGEEVPVVCSDLSRFLAHRDEEGQWYDSTTGFMVVEVKYWFPVPELPEELINSNIDE